LFTSHHFNLDPSDPNFKRTEAMETILQEKQKRRAEGRDKRDEPKVCLQPSLTSDLCHLELELIFISFQ